MTPEPLCSERPAGQPHRTLDLFAFPSDTWGWFRMLVAAALIVGTNVGFLTAQRLYGPQDTDARERLDAFLAQVMEGRDLRDYSPQEMEDLGHRLSPVTRELLRSRVPRLVIVAVFVLLLLGGAAAVYLDHPCRYRRRHRSRPFSEDDAPTVARDVKRWGTNLGLPPLKLEYRTGHGNEAQTYGFPGRETLLFHGDPVLLGHVWSDTPKVVALHELGHIKNGDAQAREMSKAVWIALFGLLLLAACAVVGVSAAEVAPTWRQAGATETLASLAVLLLLAAAIWTGLVRAFELYADRRVATWGWNNALLRLLQLPDSRPLLHPSNQKRRELLTDPARLFRVSPILAFVTGVLLSILTANLIFPVLETAFDVSLAASTRLWSELAPHFVSLPAPWGKRFLLAAVLALNLGQLLLVFLAPLAVLSYLVAGTLGTQVQREAVADLATGNPRLWGYGRLLRPAALLALGVEAGFLVAPFSSGLQFRLDGRLLILWLAGLTCFTWLWLAYVRALTRFTSGMHVGTSLPRKLRFVVTGSSVALLTVLYWPAGFARLAPRISLWTRLAHLSPAADPRTVFVYSVVMTGVVLATVAIAVYLAGAGASLIAVLLTRLWRRRPRCPSCGEPVSWTFAVGRRCVYCEEPLAPWAYQAAACDLDRGPEGRPSS